ncbi:MAG: DMT family transporter [Rhizobiaceae bacterium]|nr:DMT family transporter [Rhizobiaceae bacterium]MCV0407686.1 DMT family transporter [Rhizobiaceae bacterium]
MMLARLVPALFVVLWATGFIGAKYAMPYAEPFTFLAVRFAITFLFLLPVMLVWKGRHSTMKQAVHAAIAGMLMHGVYLGAVFWSIANGLPSGLSALIIGLQPLVTAILARPALGERILPRHWLGLGIGFVGVATVLAPRLGDLGTGVTAATLGMSFLSVLGMSAGTIWQKKFVAGTDLVAGTTWQYLGGTLLMAAGSLAFETRTVVWSTELVLAMTWLVLVLSIGAIFLLMFLIRQGEIARVASLFYLVPPVTAVMAWALFGESLSPLQVGGMVVACLGVALATAQPPTRERASR